VKLSERLKALNAKGDYPGPDEIRAAKELEAMIAWVFENCDISYECGGKWLIDEADLRERALALKQATG